MTLPPPPHKKAKFLIVGSGLVGSTIARLLQVKFPHLIDPILIDSSKQSHNTTQFLAKSHLEPEDAKDINTLRSSALAPSSIDLLTRLIASPQSQDLLWNQSGRYFSSMQVWDGATMASHTNAAPNRFAKMHFQNAHGWIGPNEIIQRILLRELYQDGLEVQHASVKKIVPVRASTEVPFSYNTVTLNHLNSKDATAQDVEEIDVDLVIGCDGALSSVRQQANIPYTLNQYEQRAFVTTIRIDDPTFDSAIQRFIPTGPIAMLPIGEGVCNIVWSTTPEQAFHLQSLSDSQLCEAINRAFTEPYGGAPVESYYHDENIIDRLATFASGIVDDFSPDAAIHIPQVISVEPNKPIDRGSFPLRQVHAKRYLKNNVLLAGDAAHAVHPLAGQGVNLGFADAVQLMKALDIAESAGMSPSSEVILQQHYEKPRRLQNEIHIQLFDAIKKFYSIPHGSVGLLRGLGMFGIDKIAPLNRAIEQFASQKIDVSHIPQAPSRSERSRDRH